MTKSLGYRRRRNWRDLVPLQSSPIRRISLRPVVRAYDPPVCDAMSRVIEEDSSMAPSTDNNGIVPVPADVFFDVSNMSPNRPVPAAMDVDDDASNNSNVDVEKGRDVNRYWAGLIMLGSGHLDVEHYEIMRRYMRAEFGSYSVPHSNTIHQSFRKVVLNKNCVRIQKVVVEIRRKSRGARETKDGTSMYVITPSEYGKLLACEMLSFAPTFQSLQGS